MEDKDFKMLCIHVEVEYDPTVHIEGVGLSYKVKKLDRELLIIQRDNPNWAIVLPSQELLTATTYGYSECATGESGQSPDFELEAVDEGEEGYFHDAERESYFYLLINYIGIEEDPNYIYDPEEEVLGHEYIFMENIEKLPKFFGNTP